MHKRNTWRKFDFHEREEIGNMINRKNKYGSRNKSKQSVITINLNGSNSFVVRQKQLTGNF